MLGAGAKLRTLIQERRPLILPGVFDGLSARLAASAGFDALYMSGSSVAAALLGRADVGLVTLTEMVTQASHIVEAGTLPVLADADTGYGNALNVIRTVRSYEKAGLAGLHIEDQVAPKKCGHFAGKELIGAEEMVGKIRAARDARRDPDFFLVARTDAIAVTGLEDAIRRARRYVDAGADALFVEAPPSIEAYRRIAEALPGVLLVADVTEGGRSPALPSQEYLRLGFQIVLFSASASRAVMKTLGSFYGQLRTAGTTLDLMDRMVAFEERNRLLGLDEFYALEQRYAASDEQRGKRPPEGSEPS
ncbi:MAG TPA: oxaloacetate decarboxylase [Casimicrobiaceae bacterium]|jgi:2-methylisocitrate lyase-like PEP mutase family enzyme|nr:oxaloacetate decarboxylase [Casimicrobiaceae bacterium]